METEWLTPRQAATLAGVHIRTINRWVKSGRVASKRTPSGRALIKRADVIGYKT